MPPPLARLEAVMASGGHLMIGTIPPVEGAAVVYDGRQALAMLRRRPDESLHDLLQRLDAATQAAQATGERIDEINVGGVLPVEAPPRRRRKR